MSYGIRSSSFVVAVTSCTFRDSVSGAGFGMALVPISGVSFSTWCMVGDMILSLVPVLPNPLSDHAVVAKVGTLMQVGVACFMMISCAMRSPCFTS